MPAVAAARSTRKVGPSRAGIEGQAGGHDGHEHVRLDREVGDQPAQAHGQVGHDLVGGGPVTAQRQDELDAERDDGDHGGEPVPDACLPVAHGPEPRVSRVPTTNDHGQLVGDLVEGWTPRPRPEPVRLEGRYVVVEPLALEHAPALFAALCGPEDAGLWTYRATEAPADVEEMAALVARMLAEPDMVTFVLRPLDGEPAGLASYLRIEAAMGSLEVGAILLARSLQRTTAATEAIHLLMVHALDTLGYRRFEWKCDAPQRAVARAAATGSGSTTRAASTTTWW